jgi:hypothetical protein
VPGIRVLKNASRFKDVDGRDNPRGPWPLARP